MTDNSDSKIVIKRAGYFPVGSLNGKHNFKRMFWVEEDGTITESIHLGAPTTSERELLICLHYLKHICVVFLHSVVGVNILDRDKPWDFKLQLSTGQILNLEVTSIADSIEHFRFDKDTERYRKWKAEKDIPIFELVKLNNLFASQPFAKILKDFEQQGLPKKARVPNPIYEEGTLLWITNLPRPKQDLAQKLRSIIIKKLKKKHENKHQTVLIIDNRTGMFDISDYHDAIKSLGSFLEETPFLEIWFYTGYFSDDDGNNSEFSFSPLKVQSFQREMLQEMSAKRSTDEHYRIIL